MAQDRDVYPDQTQSPMIFGRIEDGEFKIFKLIWNINNIE